MFIIHVNNTKIIIIIIINVYSTRCFQAVTHPSTDRARCCSTSVIGREPVLSTWYGRRQQLIENKGINV